MNKSKDAGLRPKRASFQFAGVSGFVLAALAASPGNAQQASARGAETISSDEIVVSARKRDESSQDVPIAITTLTAQGLQNAGVTNVLDLTRTTPSLYIANQAGNVNVPTISLRGQVQNDTLITLDPSVGLYLDDVYVGRAPGANFDMFDINRVEVLAGPQGTLYGRNTTGGAVRLITNQADSAGGVKGYFAQQFGNFNSIRTEGAVNLPIVDDVFAVRIAGMRHTRDGYGTRLIGTASPVTGFGTTTITSREETNDKDVGAIRVSAELKVTDQLSFEAGADYSDTRSNAGLNVATGGLFGSPFYACPNNGDFYTGCATHSGLANAEAAGGYFTTAYEFGPAATMKLILAHRDVKTLFLFDVDGSVGDLNSSILQLDQNQDTAELQLVGTILNDRLDYALGLYYFSEKGLDKSTVRPSIGSIGGPPEARSRFNPGYADNTSQSIYAQGDYAITDSLSLTLGARYTEDEKGLRVSAYLQETTPGSNDGQCAYDELGDPGGTDVLVGVGAGDQAPTESNCFRQLHASYDHVSWTVGLNWQVSEDMLLYIKSSNGYRAGGQNLRAFTNAQARPFDPETVTDVEFGMKSDLADGRIRLNLAYYHSDYSDIQVSVFGTGALGLTTTVVNQGSGTIDGLEVSGFWRLTDNFRFDGNVGYTDFELDSPANATSVVQLVPEWTSRISSAYTVSSSIGEWEGRVGYSYRSEVLWTDQKAALASIPAATEDALGLWDARLSLTVHDPNVTFSLFGTNLTDEKYNVRGLIGFFGVPGGVFNALNRGEPRMYGAEVRVNF